MILATRVITVGSGSRYSTAKTLRAACKCSRRRRPVERGRHPDGSPKRPGAVLRVQRGRLDALFTCTVLDRAIDDARRATADEAHAN